MDTHITDHSTIQLVGILTFDDSPEFACLTLVEGGQSLLDLPNHFRFKIPVSDVQLTPGNAAYRSGTLTLNDGSRGSCELQPLYDLAPSDYQSLIGHYKTDTDRSLALSWHETADGPIYFYSDEDRVTRLYPIGRLNFVSEHLETLTFAHPPATVTITPYVGDPSVLERVEWCREELILIPVEDYQLAGTLLLPLTNGPHPLVILCHLADTHRRDYYRLYAEQFVERGISAFIYDKRGSGDSTGTRLFSEVFQLTDDAIAVYRFMQKHRSINPDQVGLWGISNGSWVAPLAAERVGDAAFVIAASCSGVPPARQEQLRRANVARDLGASPRAVALISRFWQSFFKFNIDGEWNDELESLLQQVYSDEELQTLPKHPDHAPGLQPVPPHRTIEQIRAKSGGAWKEGGFEVSQVLAKLQCPLLCVWGERDDVLPVDESFQRIEQALQESGHTAYQLLTIPNATHLLYLDPPPVSGILAEVMHSHLHNVEFALGVRKLMVDWITSQLA